MNNYVLEHKEESERLEKQSKQSTYNLDEELMYLNITKGLTILDAGCGPAIASELILNKYSPRSMHCVDFQESRVEDARKRLGKDKRCTFQTENLEDISYEDNKFDVVFCKYVVEHLDNPQKAISEFYRILKPGGIIYLIDFDGLMLNFFHENETLKVMLTKFALQAPVDLYVGRKLLPFLIKAGFKNNNIEGMTKILRGQELTSEISNNYHRFNMMKTLLIDIFQNEVESQRFVKLYQSELANKENFIFYNKFIAWGTK
jgi:ubiquinone/menaquinone biosynthesis C-methylase UbiE